MGNEHRVAMKMLFCHEEDFLNKVVRTSEGHHSVCACVFERLLFHMVFKT
jgi:hypothetical protein